MTKPFRAAASRRSVRAFIAIATALLLMLFDRGASHRIVHASPSTIADENTKPGATDWDITGAGDPDIQGFATDISVNLGDTVHFKIAAPGAAAYQLKIYRLGYYHGFGATQVATVTPTATLPQSQPACINQITTTGLIDCGTWNESASWTVPATAVSGIYIAKPTRTDNGHASHIVFIVRDDSRTADVVFQTSDTTWQAYNQYPGVSSNPPGASLYCGGPLSNEGSAYLRSCATRAAKVSYNRPFDTRAHDPQSWLFNAEYPMVRWLEANGYDVKYQSGVDTDRRAFDLTGAHRPKIFLSVGHDEYWSGGQRKAVENARNAGVNLAFLSGNEMYWKTRYEPSLDGSGTAYRTLVSYKETIANAKIDPAVDPITGVPIWTGTWRDPRFAGVSDGGKPENGLIGQIFTVNCCSDRIKIPQEMGGLRLWANTGVSAVAPGDFYRTPMETLGYEWDEDLDNGSRPAGLIHLSQTTLDEPEKLSDFGANVAQGRATHSLTLYRSNSGALVFGAGTVQWSWGLDGTHDRGDSGAAHTPDQAMQQATVNLFADMDVQPLTLQQGADPSRPLIAGSKSADIFAPTSSVVFPAPGASVPSGSRLSVTGTSTDQGGGHVAGVEVSVDGGATWKAAQGTSVWNFDWTPGTPGSATIKVRAVDDSGNLEAAGAGVTVIVAQGDCPCTNLWKPTTVPPIPDAADGNPYELGVKFKSDSDGFITGIRYYKSVANTGTHLGNLWTSGGTNLAAATFVNETQSGWQEVLFNSPVPITAGTTYVASYHTNVGHYAATNDYFTGASVDSPPLHAPTSLIAGGNGVFIQGNTAFPTLSFRDTNYWVDVVFSPTNSDTTAPTITNLRATTIDSSKVVVSWTTSEPANSLVEYSTDFTFPTTLTQTVSSAAFVTSRSLLIAGLQPNTTYYYRATSIDAAGNRTTSEAPSFTVPGPTLRDTAQSDFLAGTGTGTYASETDDGELILAPIVGTEFSGSTLPQGWIEFVWGSTSGYTAMGGGEMIVDGVRVAMCATDAAGNCLPGEAFASTPSAIFTSPHSMEFVATFTGDAFQHAGLGQTLGSGSEPWAIFSTMSGGALNARTNTGAGSIDTFLGSGLVGAPHLFRIDWKANSVDYFVDGNLVVSHPLTVAGPMRPIAASDFNEFGGNVTVNWVRLTPYTGSGTFLSRVFDANSRVDWHSIQWNAVTPAGTSAAISVRTGDTPTPDGTWTAFTPIASGGPLTMNSQFIQYRAALSSASSEITPRLDDIIISTGHAPVANPDSVIVPENGTHLFQPSGSGSLTANDTDADPGDVLRVVGVTAPAHGTAVLNADGSVVYTPTSNYSGPDAFTYTVSDGLLTASAVVSIDVRFGNVPPVAVNDFYSINEDSTLTVPAAIGVLANDTDTEHDALSAMLTALPLHGTLSFGANGGFSYVPVANYAGPDAFRYKANDGADESNEAVVTITVNQVNDPPITAPDNYVAVLNQPLDVPAAFNVALGRYVSGVLANDRDVEVEDTAPMHAQLVAGPAHGHLVFGTDGGFSYTPDADFLGADSFTYQAVDHLNAAGNISTVTITVALKAVAASVSAGATVTTGNGGVDPNDPLHSSVTSPTSATVTIAQGVIAASQAPTGYTFLNQQVNISVLGPDGNDISADASAPIKLVFFIDRSLVPAGVDENSFQMFRNGVLIPNCLGATTIPAANLDPCVTDRADGPALNNNIRLTILTSHASKWNMGLSSEAIGDAPVAMNDGPYLVDYQTPLIVSAPGVLGNDIGRSSISALLVGTPVNGTVNLTPSGAFTFNPDPAACGAASFSYRATDGALQSADAIVSITIDCKPHAGDDAVTVLEDSGVTTITVLANDSDPDPGQTLSVGSVTQPANGVAAVAMSGSVVTYRPNLNFFGADSFTYTVSDNRGGSATGTVSVTVKPVNDAPKFTAGGNVTVLEDAAAQTTANWATGISAGPANESGQALNFIVSNTNNALFSAQPAVAANGTLTFTPAANANGSATVSVQAHDDGGTLDGGVDTSAAQSFTIAMTAVNDAPSFVKGADQARFGIVGVQTVANWATAISAGPADEAGQALNFIVSNNNNAMFAVQPAVAADGTLSYTPAANVIGSAIVTVALHDNGGTANGGVDTSAPQTFAISVSKAATTTTLTSSVNPSVYGQPVTFTATVGVVAPGTGQPSGTVTFMDGATTLGSAALDATGRASYSLSSLSAVAHTVTAVYGGAAAFSASTSSALTQTVAQALVTVTADSKSKVYGTANPALTVSYSGFVNGDTVAAVTTPATVSTTATATSAAGTYPITASGGAAANYTFAYVAGTLTINKAALTITADSKTRLYGSAMPTMTASYSGFVNGETSAVLATQPTLTTTATASSPFGTYPITVSGATAANYTIAFVNGTLTVSRAPLTITADNKTRVYGAPMPALTASYSGLVNGETSAVLTTQPALSTTATASSPFGTYPITVSGATAANYTITFVNGTLTVGKANSSNTVTATTATTFRFGATLTVKATIAAVAPGAGVPTGSVVFYDGAAALSGSVTLASGVATFSTSTLPVGSHSITAVYAGDANFTASTSAPAVAITVQPDLTKTVTTVADFKAGTTGANTYVSQTGDGEVMLTPTFGTEFAGPNLPSGWLSTALFTGGDVSFGEGGIQLQGAQITSLNPLYGVGHTLEFAATFSGAPQQSAGLLLAQFTTKMNGSSMALYATTINGLIPVQTLIPGSNWFGVEHRFRVDWTTAGVAYWVDGVKVATHNVSFAPSVKMTIFANDLWKTEGMLVINWMRMTPYVTSGSYLSAVFNAGFQATWMNANWTANAPAGTTVAINYRTGNTPTPDGTWTAFKPLSAPGAAMTGVSQYVQFQIAETTNNVGVTPSVSDVTIVYR